jgi:hypothetical protein
VFGFRAFLAVVTLLVAYWAFSGYRALQIRTKGPGMVDAVGSVAALLSATLFIMYLHQVTFPWSPVVVYSTLGTLVVLAAYDLVRFAFPRRFGTLAFYEHMVKMIGAFSAALSAFSGTVFGGFQPYSQLVPSVICNVVAVFFVVRFRKLPSTWTTRRVDERRVALAGGNTA